MHGAAASFKPPSLNTIDICITTGQVYHPDGLRQQTPATSKTLTTEGVNSVVCHCSDVSKNRFDLDKHLDMPHGSAVITSLHLLF